MKRIIGILLVLMFLFPASALGGPDTETSR